MEVGSNDQAIWPRSTAGHRRGFREFIRRRLDNRYPDDGGKPGKASALAPIDACEDLAHRLAQAASTSIDPPLPNLQVRGIVTTPDGAGIIVLRTARSRLAPHRLSTNKECYQRVRDLTLEIGMRQIHDMTLSANRGLSEVDSRFGELRNRFRRMTAIGPTSNIPVSSPRRFSLRVSCVPLSPCYLEKVHGVNEVQPRAHRAKVVVNPGGSPIELYTPIETYRWAPTLRGSESLEFKSAVGPRERKSVVSVYCDGAINYGFVYETHTTDQQAKEKSGHEPFCMYPGWLFGMILNAADCADRFRSYAGGSAIEYALEYEVESSHRLSVLRAGENPFRDEAGVFEPGPNSFPRYSLGPRETWSQSIGLMWRDFFNSIGVPAEDSIFEVPS